MKIPECMTRPPTGGEEDEAARRVFSAGALVAGTGLPLWVRGWDGVSVGGGSWGDVARFAIIIASALLDATERTERAEAEVAALRSASERDREHLAALQDHVSAGHILCIVCDGHGTWSAEADDGSEIPCSCAACDGTGWRDAHLSALPR